VESGKKIQKVADRLSSEHWAVLEQTAENAAVAGGNRALEFYGSNALHAVDQVGVSIADKNPSTIADYEATATILTTIDALLTQVAASIGAKVSYLAEETKSPDWFRGRLPTEVFAKVTPPETFFSPQRAEIRVVIDGIDGTIGFLMGIPLFCSGIAILLDDQPRIGAIYDPVHRTLYCASVRESDTGVVEARATVQRSSSAQSVDLIRDLTEQANGSNRQLSQSAVGVHLSRSKRDALHKILGAKGDEISVLEKVARAAGSTYALNSGLLALAFLADGALGGFVQPSTNLWDVAPAHPLLVACNKMVSRFDGSPIDYNRNERVSIVAGSPAVHQALIALLH
jgi:fructose-1,6-bisphosphatase/inositol monophosphatase family enzyme